MWSIGCILAELLFESESNIKYKNKKLGRAFLKGDSCYPLSPIHKDNRKDVSDKD